MARNPQLLPVFSSKLTQLDRFERDLSRLKHHLKMKRRIYDQTEFTNINDRIKQCQAFFKKEKYEIMRKEADKILADGHHLRNDVYGQVKNKLELSRKIRAKPYLVERDHTEMKYNINLQSEQSSLSDDRFVMEYDLTPVSKHKQMKVVSKSRVKTVGDEKMTNQRYVSDFQRKIKAELAKIPIDRLNKLKHFDSHSYNVSPKPLKKTSGVKLTPMQANYSSLHKKKNRERTNFSVIDTPSSDRYEVLKEKINKSRAQIKERQKTQIDRVRRQKMNWLEKSQVLKDLYSKYGSSSRYGNEDALDLMSKANLARANVILETEEQ